MKTECSDLEWTLRCDLAACYRLIALHGWDDLVFTHISARIPETDHHFLINPYGMMFEEITASSLVKVDMTGQPIGPSAYPVNPAGFVIHSAIHAARDDVKRPKQVAPEPDIRARRHPSDFRNSASTLAIAG